MKYHALADRIEPLSIDQTSDLIGELLRGHKGSFVGRLGSTELRALLRHRNRTENGAFKKASNFLARGELPFFTRWENRKLAFDSGFYPITPENIEKFYSLMLSSMKSLDLLGSWAPGENVFAIELSGARVTRLGSLEPYFATAPWTGELKGKKVLVIHPFAQTMQKQYESSRKHLFARSDILPEFDLQTIRAVQSLGGPDPRFPQWFDALEWMTDEALNKDFDIAIIGCGAYGFPLAANLKRAGKKAVHLGGSTQILFGIKGRRWDSLPSYRAMYNEYWVRPGTNETPGDYKKLGQNSYW